MRSSGATATLRAGLLLLALATAGRAAGRDAFKDIAKFEAGRSAMAIRSVLRADLDRRASVWLEAPNLGAMLIFRQQDWAPIAQAIPAAVEASARLPTGRSQVIAKVESTGGSTLFIEAVREADHPAVRLTFHDAPGGKYPEIAIVLPERDFERLVRAVKDVTAEFAAPKPSGYR